MTDPRLHPKEVAGYLEAKLKDTYPDVVRSGDQLQFTA